MTQPNTEQLQALLHRIHAILAPLAGEAYVVGGSVRDLLLERPFHDLDLAIAGDGLAAARAIADALQGSYHPLDNERRIGRALVSLEDVTWSVDVASLVGSLDADLARRDFAINAMALPLPVLDPRAVRDPFVGRGDIQRRTIRGLSEAALVDDPARLLRAVRLAGELDFAIDNATLGWMRAHAAKVTEISAERARDELARILALPAALLQLRVLDDLDILCALIPELGVTKGVGQPPNHHYWDVFNHNMETVGFADGILQTAEREADPALREMPWRPAFTEHFAEELSSGRRRIVSFKMASLLHDIAKPQTKTQEPSGRMRFLGHNTLGSEIAMAVMERLRFSRREVRLVGTMVEHHLRPVQISNRWEPPTRRAVYRFFRDLDDAAIDTIFLSFADHLAAVGPRLTLNGWRRHTALARTTIEIGFEEQAVIAAPRLVTGHDLITTLALQPGPQVGLLLEAVREAHAAGEITTREEALTLATALKENQ